MSFCEHNGGGVGHCPRCTIDDLQKKLAEVQDEIKQYKEREDFNPPVTCSDCCSIVSKADNDRAFAEGVANAALARATRIMDVVKQIDKKCFGKKGLAPHIKAITQKAIKEEQ